MRRSPSMSATAMSATGPQGSFPPGEPSVGTLKAQEKYENGWACEDTARMWDCSPGSGVQPRTRASVAPQ